MTIDTKDGPNDVTSVTLTNLEWTYVGIALSLMYQKGRLPDQLDAAFTTFVSEAAFQLSSDAERTEALEWLMRHPKYNRRNHKDD